MNSRSENCVIDIPQENQEDITDFKLSKPFSDRNRYPSESSSLDSNTTDICRICHCEGASDLPLITPCYCAGSLRYVHQTCLQQWIKSSNIRSCELCKFQFIMQTKVKPFNEWEYLEMSGLERKKLACAMLFHIIAMTCVCWSLYVLIDRTLDEVRKGHLEWPFWTKLIVVGIGFMGGIVFMYIQCRAYFVLCKRWKAYNRVIYVQNAPEKTALQLSRQPLTSAIEKDTSGPSCSFKSYVEPRNKRDTIAETNCIDIKGVRNLRIFFGDENQIRVHRDDRRSDECKALTQPERIEETSSNGRGNVTDKGNVYGNTSLHIQIGNGGAANESKNCVDADANDEEKTTNKDQSVVKVQFKKAEIVIEFGQKNIEGTPLKRPATIVDGGGGGYDTCDGIVENASSSSSPKRKFSSEEYLDSELKYTESVPNETNESPTSKLLINYRCSKVPFNNYFKERATLKDWKSSEDLLDVRSSLPNF